ncbi:MAG: lon2 [Acidobacteria bacterium]|nr:lon2 [Acidobacteriota bacterium]
MVKRLKDSNDESINYPMIPIRDVVVFPSTIVAFKIGRPTSISALEMALTGNRTVFLVTQRNPEVANPKRDQLYDVGSVGNVLTEEKLENGQYRVVVKGSHRGTLVAVAKRKGAYIAAVGPTTKPPDSGKPVTEIMQRVGGLLQDYLPMIADSLEARIKITLNTSNPSTLSDSVASWLPLVSTEDKQHLLETFSPYERLLKLATLLERSAGEPPSRLRKK